MSDQENKNPEQNNGPEFVAYNVREGGNGKGYWDKIGVGFMHRDGKGVDIRLNSLPMDGHVTLRERAQEFKQKQESESPKQDFSQSRSPKVD
jgi:hypothetical protein